ncbi:PIN domain-containing protein [Deinococcus sp. UYEF24]
MDTLLSFLPTLDFDHQSTDIAADIHHQLRVTGTLIEDADLPIAATALRHDATLVTRNIKHFQRIPGLKLIDWQKE